MAEQLGPLQKSSFEICLSYFRPTLIHLMILLTKRAKKLKFFLCDQLQIHFTQFS